VMKVGNHWFGPAISDFCVSGFITVASSGEPIITAWTRATLKVSPSSLVHCCLILSQVEQNLGVVRRSLTRLNLANSKLGTGG
jgi:hypothetical protein